MSRTVINNIGAIVTGDLAAPRRNAESLAIRDGVIEGFGVEPRPEDTVFDAAGLTVVPGLIDGHVHPTIGEYSPVQESTAWIRAYLHCGTTTLISAGELHVPGLPLADPDPQIFKHLALVNARCARERPSGAKVHSGTLMLAPGLAEADIQEAGDGGVRLAKFIFYPFSADRTEAQQYVEWCHQRGITVKIHSGGVSRSGASQVAGFDIATALGVDIVGHATGGPIPMPEKELRRLVDETSIFLEIATAGNDRLTRDLVGWAMEAGVVDRLTLGTDTPSGTGVLPRAMLRNLLLLSAVAGLPADQAICVATGNTARAHGLDQGILAEGRPADLVLLGPIEGSVASDALEAIQIGDLPGVSMVFVDGVPLVRRSEQTPPPRYRAEEVAA